MKQLLCYFQSCWSRKDLRFHNLTFLLPLCSKKLLIWKISHRNYPLKRRAWGLSVLTSASFYKFTNYFIEVDWLLLNKKLKEYCTSKMCVLIVDTMKSSALQKEILWYLAHLMIYSLFLQYRVMFSWKIGWVGFQWQHTVSARISEFRKKIVLFSFNLNLCLVSSGSWWRSCCGYGQNQLYYQYKFWERRTRE